MRRVIVIGSGGAGKSTLARWLGEILGLPVIHLDVEHWRPGWVEPPKEEWRRRVGELVTGESWVMDGNYGGTMEARMAACDAVIFLDLPRALCVWRVFKRVVTYRKNTRPDMAEGCHEKLDFKFLLWVWGYPKRTRPKVVRLLEAHRGTKEIFWLRSRAEVEDFLARLAERRMAETEGRAAV
jgi:adenylate kinase family enzyme